jgi:hypothetical protein
MANIDYRDNLWFLTANGLNAEMGFFSLAAAGSFAGNNLNSDFSLTNRAIVEMVKSGSRITCRRALAHLRFAK